MRFIARHKLALGVTGVLGLGALVFVLVYFQPHKLFIDQKVNEAGLTSAPPSSKQPAASPKEPAVIDPAPAPPSAAPPAEPQLLSQGQFRSLEHETTGRASITKLADGSRVLRFDNFATSNGPDLRVYLSAGSSDASFGKEYGIDFVELGKLKGNLGNQNYMVPSTVDLSKYSNAVVWCKRFTVGFGVATLS
ncbi:MAG: DM13 domain-containing protein [Actinomycetota bacterium]